MLISVKYVTYSTLHLFKSITINVEIIADEKMNDFYFSHLISTAFKIPSL